jgi:ribosomal protein S14
MTDDKITRLSVGFKHNDNDKELQVKEPPLRNWDGRPCAHLGFYVDPSKDTVECRDCGEKLNPIWVLTRIANDEGRYVANHKRYQDEMKRLKNRRRTKCRKCGEMTSISRN